MVTAAIWLAWFGAIVLGAPGFVALLDAPNISQCRLNIWLYGGIGAVSIAASLAMIAVNS